MTAPTLRDLVTAAARELRSAEGDARENPLHEARTLLEAAVGVERGRFVLVADEPVAREDTARFWDMVADRARGVPLQLILGSTAFHAVTLRVEEGVFIPRPETELLVEEALAATRRRLRGMPRDGRPGGLHVLDLCTGTGAVAVAVAADLRDQSRVTVHAGDWSLRAVHLARRNAADNGVEVDVRRSDLFSAFADLEHRMDVLAANPPYIAESEAASLPLEVRLGDPHDALFDPDGGTGFHRRIADRGRTFLTVGGTIVLEIGETQGESVENMLMGLGYRAVVTLPDLTGRDRFVRGTWWGDEEPPTDLS